MPRFGYGRSLVQGRIISATIASTPSSLLTGLLAYWKFDNNGSGGVSLLDSSGNGRTLTTPNGIGTLESVTGVINQSALISADNETYLSRSGTFLNGSRDEYSISAWVFTFEPLLFIVNQSTSGNWSGSSIAMDLTNGKLVGTIFWSSTPNYDRATGSSDVNDEQWNHLAMTWKRTGSLKVYVNGALDGSISSSGNYANIPTENVSLNGNADGSFAMGKDCTIDEVGIWNKELSASEITSLYNSGDGKSYPF
jgi:hypothetical protein